MDSAGASAERLAELSSPRGLFISRKTSGGASRCRIPGGRPVEHARLHGDRGIAVAGRVRLLSRHDASVRASGTGLGYSGRTLPAGGCVPHDAGL